MSKLKPLILVGGLPKSGKSSFIDNASRFLPEAVKFHEEIYVNKLSPSQRDYGLNYKDNAVRAVKDLMVNDVALVTQGEHKAVFVESNFFVVPEYRKLFREKCLTRNHFPIYVSVFIPEDIRSRNNPLDKYMESDNQFFMKNNKRPKPEGFVVMSTRQLISFLKERNDST